MSRGYDRRHGSRNHGDPGSWANRANRDRNPLVPSFGAATASKEAERCHGDARSAPHVLSRSNRPFALFRQVRPGESSAMPCGTVFVKKRPLGKTGLFVSELALGTWGLSGDGYGAVAPEEAERVVLRALDMGVSLFDTSDAYGAGQTEALLGRVLDGREVTVVTRGGIDLTSIPPAQNFAPRYLEAAITRSQKRLRRERIDLYLLHNPSEECLRKGEAIRALEDAVKTGRVAHWGVAVGDTEAARAAIDHGAEVIELAYNMFHALDLHRLAGEIMVAGVGVLARSTLSYGLLAGLWAKDRGFPVNDHRSERWTRLELERRIEQLDAVRYLVRGDVQTMRAAAVRFALANHLVTSAVLGPRSTLQLEQLVREVGSGPTYIPDHDLAALPRALARVGIST